MSTVCGVGLRAGDYRTSYSVAEAWCVSFQTLNSRLLLGSRLEDADTLAPTLVLEQQSVLGCLEFVVKKGEVKGDSQQDGGRVATISSKVGIATKLSCGFVRGTEYGVQNVAI